MNKKKVLIVAPTKRQVDFYFQDYILPFLTSNKATMNLDKTETDTHIFYFKTINNPSGLRGLSVDSIFASNDISIKEYREQLLPLVEYNDSRINIF